MNLRQAFKKLLELSREQLKYQIMIIAMGFGTALFAACIPFLLKRLFENLETHAPMSILYSILLIMGIYTLSILIDLISGLVSNVAETRAGAILKKRLLFQSIHLPWEYYQSHGKGEVLSRALSDTEQIGRNISLIPALIIELFSLIIAGIVLLKLNFVLGIYALCTIPIYFISMRCFVGRLKATSKQEREEYARSVELFRDILDGLQEIKLFSADGHFKGKLDQVLEGWIGTVKKTALYQTLNYSVQSYLSTLFPLIALGLGAYLVQKGSINLGVVVATYSYLGRLYRPIERLAYLWSIVVRNIPTMERVYELLDYQSHGEVVGQSQPKPACRSIELSNVQWRYKERNILKGVNLSIHPNEQIAIVGQSGAGKSTIAWLLLGLFQPQEGQIFIDDRPVTEYSVNDLIGQIAYTSAHPHIFQGTLKDNVTLGADLPREEVIKVLETCGLSEMDLDKKVGEGMGDLSLGQKQRVGLARVILRKPKIIILDEATSGIDSQIEERILDSIFKLNAITIVMSHRLSTVKHCPRVALLWDGIISEDGPHTELIQMNQNYRWVFKDQLAAG